MEREEICYCPEWGQGSAVHGSSRPVEDDGFQALHRPISSMVRAATPKDRVMPDPPGEVTILTPGAALRERYGCSGCLAYTPYQRWAIFIEGTQRNPEMYRRISSSTSSLL